MSAWGVQFLHPDNLTLWISDVCMKPAGPLAGWGEFLPLLRIWVPQADERGSLPPEVQSPLSRSWVCWLFVAGHCGFQVCPLIFMGQEAGFSFNVFCLLRFFLVVVSVNFGWFGLLLNLQLLSHLTIPSFTTPWLELDVKASQFPILNMIYGGFD